jgi:hypothetical protein
LDEERCPFCQCASYQRVDPQGVVIAFAKDRECTACGAVWRPACPRWGACVFVVVGLALLSLAAFAVITALAQPERSVTPSTGAPVAPVYVAAVSGAVGALCVGYGSLALAGKVGTFRVVKEPPRGQDGPD